MGVIYSSAEIINSKVPKDGDHLVAAKKLIETVPKIEGTVMTLVHGSVPEGRPKRRSDLDVLITYRFDQANQEPLVVDRIKSSLDDIGAETGVKIEPNIWPSDEPIAARNERMYDRLFAHHLADSMMDPDWTVGEADEIILDIAAMPVEENIINKIMFNYLTYKHTGVSRAPRNFDESDPMAFLAFQRVLELPKALGRKAAQRMGILHPNEEGGFVKTLDESNAGDDFHESIQGLRSIDKQYSEFLEYMCTRPRSTATHDLVEYKMWLSDRYKKSLSLGMIATTSYTRYLSTEI